MNRMSLFSSRLFSLFGLATVTFLTGCATNPNFGNSAENGYTVSTPSERVAIKKYNSQKDKALPPEVAAFLHESEMDENTAKKLTPTKVGRGSYNHAMLNQAKATDIVSIDPTKIAPPIALPDYGVEETLQKPVDYVAKAPAYFAESLAYQASTPVTRTKSYASVKPKPRKTTVKKTTRNSSVKAKPITASKKTTTTNKKTSAPRKRVATKK